MEPTRKQPYHHGDLRAALMAAAKDELAEHGVEGFTLRSCARRAGVSHGAPAHHFGDIRGLFTALATEAFKLLTQAMDEETTGVTPGSMEHLIGVALGYTCFAIDNPDLFKLMFRTGRLDTNDPSLQSAGHIALGRASGAVGAFYSHPEPRQDRALARQVYGLWAYAHGVSGLIIEGQFGPLENAHRVAQDLVPPTVVRMFSDSERRG